MDSGNIELQSKRIFVAGHNGLVGSALVRCLQAKGYKNILCKNRAELDLTKQADVENYFHTTKPEIVIDAAAMVGGIHANNSYRAEFIYYNLAIQNNLIWSAYKNDVERFVFLGSSCIYPRHAPQPMPENCLLTSELEHSNRPYALAKISGLELVSALRNEYNRNYFSVMPTNIYGTNDNFHPENSHVLPALLRRFVEAKHANAPEVVVWGTGKPKREFIYVDDCADAIVHLMETVSLNSFKNTSLASTGWAHINIGTGQEISIGALAHLVADVVGYKGEVRFDPSKLDGTPRKLVDTALLTSFGWQPRTSLRDGLKKTLDWFYAAKHISRDIAQGL